MDSFSQELTNSDTLMKTRMSQFHLMRAEFNTLEKKHSGNLSTKPLSQVCQKYSNVLLQSSEYIETLLVAVPM